MIGSMAFSRGHTPSRGATPSYTPAVHSPIASGVWSRSGMTPSYTPGVQTPMASGFYIASGMTPSYSPAEHSPVASAFGLRGGFTPSYSPAAESPMELDLYWRSGMTPRYPPTEHSPTSTMKQSNDSDSNTSPLYDITPSYTPKTQGGSKMAAVPVAESMFTTSSTPYGDRCYSPELVVSEDKIAVATEALVTALGLCVEKSTKRKSHVRNDVQKFVWPKVYALCKAFLDTPNTSKKRKHEEMY